MNNLGLFKKDKPSNISNERGPEYKDQIAAMVNDEYWTVLNSSLLKLSSTNKKLCHRVNALKQALQTYGPDSEKLPDRRQNEGNAKGFVFHGHVNDSNGKTYELEWAVVDRKKRVLALTHFGKHENFKFKQEPLNQVAIDRILAAPENIRIMGRTSKKIDEAKEKVERVERNYRNIA